MSGTESGEGESTEVLGNMLGDVEELPKKKQKKRLAEGGGKHSDELAIHLP